MSTFDMPKTGTWEQRGGWVVRALATEFGLTLEQAAGLVGNLGYESRGFATLQEMAPTVTGSKGGFGWAQWTGPRRRGFEAWATAHHLPVASDEANYGYLVEELHDDYASTIAALKKAATLEKAVFSVGQTYERPGGTTPDHLPGYDDRLAWARRALAGAKSDSAQVLPTSAGPVAGQPVPSTLSPNDALDRVQEALRDAGLYTGPIDHDFGKGSRAALNALLRAAGQAAI